MGLLNRWRERTASDPAELPGSAEVADAVRAAWRGDMTGADDALYRMRRSDLLRLAPMLEDLAGRAREAVPLAFSDDAYEWRRR